MLTEIRNGLQQYLNVIGVSAIFPASVLEAGLAELEAELVHVALEVRSSERRGHTLSQASTDFENYPHLARLHALFNSVLTLTLPPFLLDWVRSYIANAPRHDSEWLLAALANQAGRHPIAEVRGLCRFMLFEAVRLGLVVFAKSQPDEIFGIGMDLENLDKIAEEEVDYWLKQGHTAGSDLRPLNVLIASAFVNLHRHADEFQQALIAVNSSMVEEFRVRAEREATLASMDVIDAIIVRNRFARDFDEQRLSTQMLRVRNHHILGPIKSNTLEQRLSRTLKHGLPKRSGTALLDILQTASVQGEEL